MQAGQDVICQETRDFAGHGCSLGPGACGKECGKRIVAGCEDRDVDGVA